MIRTYAQFLLSVKNDVKRARRFYVEADRLEEEAEVSRRDANAAGDSSMNANVVDDKVDSIIVINEQG